MKYILMLCVFRSDMTGSFSNPQQAVEISSCAGVPKNKNKKNDRTSTNQQMHNIAL